MRLFRRRERFDRPRLVLWGTRRGDATIGFRTGLEIHTSAGAVWILGCASLQRDYWAVAVDPFLIPRLPR